ncbi:hypothetical protein U27_05591 [Candidatus Vecturithrix granuli]|uniref:Uncharacterized protein n=1 Tax=Vecturithrix granuli TaxID=1499967 RepID=A0A081C212_VECG1|nr:hypothetical protein U27_05591 [Candidatus Vecturithrix granuli]
MNLTFPNNNSIPAVRRPVLEVSFGSGNADDWKQAIVSLTVEIGLVPTVDVVEIQLSALDQAPVVAVDDAGSVSLGYEDSSPNLVFTGQVETVHYTIDGTTRISATNGGASLAKLRVNQSYEQQKAGDIVNDLVGRVGVGTETIQDGINFPFYVIDDRLSAYRHIAELARKSGYLAFFSPEGNLNFAPFAAGQTVQTFTYGVDILSLQLIEATPILGTVTTTGEGAAGSQGQEAWNWLVKDPSSVKRSAGNGEPQREVQDASLRSSDAVQNAADGIANSAGLMKFIGRLLVPGASAVTVASAIEIVDAPQEVLNGLCPVHRVRHRFSKREGFTTLIEFSKTDGGGFGGLGGFL